MFKFFKFVPSLFNVITLVSEIQFRSFIFALEFCIFFPFFFF